MIAFKIKPGRVIHYFGFPVEVVKLTPGGVLVQADDATVALIYAAEGREPIPTPQADVQSGPPPTPPGV